MESSGASNRFRRKAIQVDAAQRKIQEYIRLGHIEEVRLEDAFGRRLAADVLATNHLPHFSRSGVDGFSIVSGSTIRASSEKPLILEVIETIPCGSIPGKKVTKETASRIMTGAMMPDGADAVIMLEMAESFEAEGKSFISIKKEQKSGQNVTPAGHELSEGNRVLEKGRKIRAGEAALLATFGYGKVNVFKRPKVAVFATGSELLTIDEPLQLGKIRNSNSYMLAAQIMEAGGIPIHFGSIPDDAEQAKERILEALTDADFVVTTGGVSVGDYDIVAHIFEQWEGTMLFNKVTMRPGSVTTAGVWEGKLIFALSGNPGACFVGFELFVSPVIKGMQGSKDIYLPEQTVILADDFPKVNAYHRYVRGRTYVENGNVYVKQAGIDQSSITVSIKDSNCLIVVPPGGEGMTAGQLVTVLKLGEE